MSKFEKMDLILTAYNIQYSGEEIRAHLLEAGLVIVPREPTAVMVKAAFALGSEAQCAPEVWEAMIDEALKDSK